MESLRINEGLQEQAPDAQSSAASRKAVFSGTTTGCERPNWEHGILEGFYTVLFFRFAEKPGSTDMAVIAGLALFAGLMIWIFRGIDPKLLGPVVLYIVVIITMSVGALLVPAANRLLFWGALLFIASDVVLAVNKFLVAIPHGRLINITLYFLAQFTIVSAARTIWMDKGTGNGTF
jgi:hypothetical protein